MVRHALTMMAGTLLSRFLGLAREIITAALFGATRQLDAFYIAYTLANLSRQLLAEGALSAAFVPVFSQALARDGEKRARGLAKQAMAVLVVVGGLVVLGGFMLAPWLVRLMAPGFSATDSHLALLLTRRILPFLFLMSLAALAMGVLNSLGSFFVPAVAPALSNVIYIAIVLLAFADLGVWSLVVAVLLGGFFQFFLQWIWALKKGFVLLPARPDPRDEELKRMLLLFIPYAAGLSLNQVNPIISRMLGSFLQDGSISVLNYADRVLQLPLGLFIIAISQAVLPLLARHALEEEETFRDVTRDSLRFALFVVLPVMAGMVLISDEMVHLLFRRGAFGDWAWRATSGALAMYALGLPGMACTTVVMRALYARSLPGEALKVTATSVGCNLLFSLLLMKILGTSGLALAASLAFTASAWVGIRLLCRDMGLMLRIIGWKWFRPILCGLTALVLVVLGGMSLWAYPTAGSLGIKMGWVLGMTFLGASAYGVTTWQMGCEEWHWLTNAIRRDHVDE